MGSTFSVGVRQLGFERTSMLKDPKRDLAGHLADEPLYMTVFLLLCPFLDRDFIRHYSSSLMLVPADRSERIISPLQG